MPVLVPIYNLSIFLLNFCRFIIKAPSALPRKDRNLGNVIISEQKDKSIAKYQVSSIFIIFLIIVIYIQELF